MKLNILKFVSTAVVILVMYAAVPAQVNNSSELQEGERVVIKKVDDGKLPARFNYDRPFLISINRGVPDAPSIKGELIKLMSGDGMLDKVLFETFGSEGLTNVEVKIGKRVPVEIAQAVIRVLSGRESLPLTVYVYKDDIITQDNRQHFFAYTQRIIIGSLGERKGKALNKERTEALLREGITQKEFIKLLSESK